jgi:transcription antitermination factor NusG
MPESEMVNTDKPWYALYTRSRHEKRVADALEQRGFDAYLPLVPRVSQWHDRKKTVSWPLFPGYVFVRFSTDETTSILSIPGSVQVIGVAGKPAPIADEDIENVRRFAACLAETGVIPRPIPLIERGQRVVVRSGPFSGVRGLVLETRATDRVLIQIGLSAIGQALKIELDADSVELVGEKDREQAK